MSCLNVELDVKLCFIPGLISKSALSLHNLNSLPVNSEIFVRVIKPLLNGEIALAFTDVGKSYFSCEFLTSQKCLGAIK